MSAETLEYAVVTFAFGGGVGCGGGEGVCYFILVAMVGTKDSMGGVV